MTGYDNFNQENNTGYTHQQLTDAGCNEHMQNHEIASKISVHNYNTTLTGQQEAMAAAGANGGGSAWILLVLAVIGLLIYFVGVPIYNSMSVATKENTHTQFLKHYTIKKNVNPYYEPIDSPDSLRTMYRQVFTPKEIEAMDTQCYGCKYYITPDIQQLREYAYKIGKGKRFDEVTLTFLNNKYTNDGGGYIYTFVPDKNHYGHLIFTNTSWVDVKGANPAVYPELKKKE